MPVLQSPTATPRASVAHLIERTKDLLLGSGREELNLLSTTLSRTETSFVLSYALDGLNRGSYIAIDTELMFVWAAQPEASSQTCQVTVQRGMKGTVEAEHVANSVVYLNPFFSRWQLRKTLQDEIRSWGPQVFRVKTLDLATSDFVRGYDMGSLGEWFYILDVRMSPDLLNATPSDKNWRSLPYRVEHSANTTTFPSGNALTITDPIGVFDAPRTVHLVYGAPFSVNTFTDAVTLITTVGLDYSDLDIAPYGAAWRLAASREVRRMLVEAQSQAADLQNFPPGYMVKAAQEFKMLRDSRLNDAIQRLSAQYPTRRTA